MCAKLDFNKRVFQMGTEYLANVPQVCTTWAIVYVIVRGVMTVLYPPYINLTIQKCLCYTFKNC